MTDGILLNLVRESLDLVPRGIDNVPQNVGKGTIGLVLGDIVFLLV